MKLGGLLEWAGQDIRNAPRMLASMIPFYDASQSMGQGNWGQFAQDMGYEALGPMGDFAKYAGMAAPGLFGVIRSVDEVEGGATPLLKNIISSNRYDVDEVGKRSGRQSFEYRMRGADSWNEVKPTLRDPDTGKVFDRPPERFNAEVAQAVPESDEFGVRFRYELKPGWVEDVPQTEGLMYRGMSWEEYQDILANKRIKSAGAYNIGDQQQGLTYFTDDAGSATHYAHGFAPVQYKASPEKPAVVVAVKKRQGVYVEGTGQHEIGIPDEISADDIVEVWEGMPFVERRAGSADIIEDFGGRRDGSSSPVSASVAWRKVK